MRTTWMALLGVLAAAGCNQGPAPASVPSMVGMSQDYQVLQGRTGPGLVRDPRSPIPDVPKPIGFKPVVDRSSASTDGYARTVRHVYEGLSTSGEAVTFYRQQLPLEGWTYRGMRSDGATDAVLTFAKGNEDLAVRIDERRGVTTLVIDIARTGALPPAPGSAGGATGG